MDEKDAIKINNAILLLLQMVMNEINKEERILTDKRGFQYINPKVIAFQKLSDHLANLLIELGLTPLGRTK